MRAEKIFEPGPGWARRGLAGPGSAWNGKSSAANASLHQFGQDAARQGAAWLGKSMQSESLATAQCGTNFRGSAGHGSAMQCTANRFPVCATRDNFPWRDLTWLGKAQPGMAWHGSANRQGHERPTISRCKKQNSLPAEKLNRHPENKTTHENDKCKVDRYPAACVAQRPFG